MRSERPPAAPITLHAALHDRTLEQSLDWGPDVKRTSHPLITTYEPEENVIR